MHHDLIVTAKQKRPDHGAFKVVRSLRFHRRESYNFNLTRNLKSSESLAADPPEGLAVQRLVAGCGGITPRTLPVIRHRKIGTCRDCRSLRHGNPEMLQPGPRGEHSSTKCLGYYKWATPGF